MKDPLRTLQDTDAALKAVPVNTEQTLAGYAPMPADLEARIFSAEYLNLKDTFPDEAVENSVSEFVAMTMKVTEDANKRGDSFLYSLVAHSGTGRAPPRFLKVYGLNQLQRTAAVMLLLRKRDRVNKAQLHAVSQTVAQLAQRAQELHDEGNRLTRWDFFKMAIFGREPVVEAIQRRRIKENRPHVDMN